MDGNRTRRAAAGQASPAWSKVPTALRKAVALALLWTGAALVLDGWGQEVVPKGAPADVETPKPAEKRSEKLEAVPDAATSAPAEKAQGDSALPAKEPLLKVVPNAPAKDAAEKPAPEKGEAEKPASKPATAPLTKAFPNEAPLSPPIAISFSFDQAEWKDVFSSLAKIAGRTLYIQNMPPDKFTYFDRRTYTFPEALDVINQVLLPKGFASFTKENFLIVADVKDGIPPDLVETVSIAELPKRGKTELVRVRVPIEGMTADDAKKEFEPLLSKPVGKIAPMPSTNQILIIDTARVVQQIIDLMRGEQDATSVSVKVFQLKYISAIEAERVVREMLGMTQRGEASPTSGRPGTSPSSSRGGDDRRARIQEMMQRFGPGGPGGPFPPGQPPGAQPGQPSPQQASAASTKGPYVSINPRTNTLFVTATPDKLAMVAEVVKTLDVADSADESGFVSQTPTLEVYEVELDTAEGVAQALAQTLFNQSLDAQVSPHPSNRAILVFAAPKEHAKVREFLDKMRTEGTKVEVIPLRVLGAANVATLIKTLLGQKKNESQSFPFFFYSRGRGSEEDQKLGGRLSVEAETASNQLVVRGTQTQIDEVKLILRDLGEPIGLTGRRDRFRTIPVGDGDPAAMLERIRKVWPQVSPNNPIKIEVLGGQGRDREPADEPAKPKTKEPPENSSAGPQGQTRWEVPWIDAEPLQVAVARARGKSEAYQLTAAQEPATPRPAFPRNTTGANQERDRPRQPAPRPFSPQTKSEASKGPVSKPGAPVTVVVDEQGNISLFSEDLEALDVLESLLKSMAPPPGRGTAGIAIYYLKEADAQEVAYQIDEVLYGSQISFFSSNEDEDARARIVPDLRTNSLLVVGPPSEHRKVEGLLKMLDAEDPPASGIIGTPVIIPVKYARAKDVEEVIKQVFAAQVHVQDNRQGQQNQFGGGFSIGRRSSNRRDDTRGKIFVSVDERANSIVALGPRAMIDQVKELVAQLDEDAKENRRISTVVTLKNARPEKIEKAMNTLFGAKIPESEKKADASKQKKDGEEQQPGGFNPDMRSRFRNGGGPSFFRR